MKTIAVTGATGFIGTHVIHVLKEIGGFRIIAVGRNIARLRSLETEYVVYDLNSPTPDCYQRLHSPDHLIHLAWENLPNYDELVHVEKNFPNSYRFIKEMVAHGLNHVTVVGTCLEYGLQNGQMHETASAAPTTNYAVAKDALRRCLESLRHHYLFDLNWLRLFYVFGQGQSKRSLWGQLQTAIDAKQPTFDMSSGEQIRDFVPIEVAALYITKAALQKRYTGIINICSGTPLSVRRFVENALMQAQVQMDLNLGVYPYLDYEPLAFWGHPEKLMMATGAYEEEHGHET